MKIYITFGQDHYHQVGGVTFDHNCVAEIKCQSHALGRVLARNLFGLKFCTSYTREGIEPHLHLYPRGIIAAN